MSVSHGILALVPTKKADFGLRIYNPDGSEAEKSGNGLRIFARYLHATGKTKKKHFTVETKGGLVTIDLHVDRHGDASAVTVEMGQATFKPAALPCTLAADELIQQPIDAAGRTLSFTGVSVGNPHRSRARPKKRRMADPWVSMSRSSNPCTVGRNSLRSPRWFLPNWPVR